MELSSTDKSSKTNTSEPDIDAIESREFIHRKRYQFKTKHYEEVITKCKARNKKVPYIDSSIKYDIHSRELKTLHQKFGI